MNDKLKSQMTHSEPPKYVYNEQEDGSIDFAQVLPGNAIPRIRARAYEIRVSMERPPHLMPIELAAEPKRIYGDVATDVDRYLRTFERLDTNLGVAQIGNKGSGKTTLIRCLTNRAVMLDMPIIFVNNPYPREVLEHVARAIPQDSVWIFEEFDKNFAKSEGGNIDTSYQDVLLSLFDGSVVGGKKLYVIAANDRSKISPFLMHRPGRIRYTKYYERLPHTTMIGYVKDNLKTNRPIDIVHFVKLRGIYPDLNFDMMSAVVDEMNHNPKLNVMDAMNVMFGNTGTGNGISYIATVTMPDGTVHKVFAKEHTYYGKGALINVGLAELNDTEDDIFSDIKLKEEDFVSHSDDVKELTYVKDGISFHLMLTKGEIGDAPIISLGTVTETNADYEEVHRHLQECNNKRRMALEAKFERQRKEREEKAKTDKKEEAGKSGLFLRPSGIGMGFASGNNAESGRVSAGVRTAGAGQSLGEQFSSSLTISRGVLGDALGNGEAGQARSSRIVNSSPRIMDNNLCAEIDKLPSITAAQATEGLDAYKASYPGNIPAFGNKSGMNGHAAWSSKHHLSNGGGDSAEGSAG